MSKTRRKTPPAPPVNKPATRSPDDDDLDGDPVPAPSTSTLAASAVTADDFADLDALADSGADPDAEVPPAPVETPAPLFFDGELHDPAPTDGARGEPAVIASDDNQPPATPPVSDTLLDAIATGEADPQEPGGTPASLPTSSPAADAPPKSKKGKKGSPAEILGDPETLCDRATAATTAGPFLDLAIAALPVYLRQGGSWQQVMHAAGARTAAYMAENGPTHFDINMEGAGDIASLLARGPDAILFSDFTAYQLEAAEGELPMASMPGDLPLPSSKSHRKVLGRMKVPATPGMAAIYNLADKGDKVLGPVLETIMAYFGKYADVVRPILALLIVGLAGYRHDRALVRAQGDIRVAHQPAQPASAPTTP